MLTCVAHCPINQFNHPPAPEDPSHAGAVRFEGCSPPPAVAPPVLGEFVSFVGSIDPAHRIASASANCRQCVGIPFPCLTAPV